MLKNILKKSILFIYLIALISCSFFVYADYTSQIEDNITAPCGNIGICSYWVSGTSVGAKCYNSTPGTTDGYCKLWKNGGTYGTFTVNSSPDGNPGVIPADYHCKIAVREIYLNSSIFSQDINITINGLTETISDPGGDVPLTIVSTNRFHFDGGSVGADNITFRGLANSTYIDYFSIQDCIDPNLPSPVPELSDYALMAALVLTVGGFFVMRKQEN